MNLMYMIMETFILQYNSTLHKYYVNFFYIMLHYNTSITKVDTRIGLLQACL